jgi:uncharacterized membrane protein
MTAEAPNRPSLNVSSIRNSPWLIPAIAGVIALAAVLILRPNLGLLGEVGLAIQIHLLAALIAFFLGVAMLASRKGRRFHRIAGWVWFVVIMTVALSSLFIAEINDGAWSWIHILSGLTLVFAPLGVIAARRHNVKAHRRHMTLIFIGGMVVAGGFTFLPGRLMWAMFFGG